VQTEHETEAPVPSDNLHVAVIRNYVFDINHYIILYNVGLHQVKVGYITATIHIITYQDK